MRYGRQAIAGVWLAGWPAVGAFAQGPLSVGESGAPDWQQQLIYAAGVLILIALIVGAIWVVVYRTRRPPEMEGIYMEPAVSGSRFEQLLSEIQGLTLRVQGGESKGYYRKIEQLVRIFLERIGYKGARHLSKGEIEALLGSGEIQQDISAALMSIFQRSQQGVIHETEKLDFSAAELLRDLRTIIKRVEQTPSRS